MYERQPLTEDFNNTLHSTSIPALFQSQKHKYSISRLSVPTRATLSRKHCIPPCGPLYNAICICIQIVRSADLVLIQLTYHFLSNIRDKFQRDDWQVSRNGWVVSKLRSQQLVIHPWISSQLIGSVSMSAGVPMTDKSSSFQLDDPSSEFVSWLTSRLILTELICELRQPS